MVKVGALAAGLVSIAIAACSVLGVPFTIKTAGAPTNLCMAALGGGVLARNPVSGLGFIHPDGKAVSVLWPFGYSARIEGAQAVLLDDEGTVVAREGDKVTLGGGYGAGDDTFTACGVVSIEEPG